MTKKKTKQIIWTEDEINRLHRLWDEFPFNVKKYSKFKKIALHFPNRTVHSIRRKCWREGLKNYGIKRGETTSKCSYCGTEIQTYKRYVEMYDNLWCDTCREIIRRQWAKTKKGKEYHRNYYHNVIKKKKE